jgi:hypothetical protein
VHFTHISAILCRIIHQLKLLESPLEGPRPDLSKRYPHIFLNVFKVFSPILRYSIPLDLLSKSGTMPQAA